MNKILLTIILVFGLLQTINAQDKSYIVGQELSDNTGGDIYNLVENETPKNQIDTRNNKFLKSDSTQIFNYDKEKDSKNVSYEANFVFQYGGESKLVLLLPKVNLLRKHQFDVIKPYYGIEFGIQPLLVAVCGSVSGIVGIEKNFISFETSFSHIRVPRIYYDENDVKGPFSQNLLNLKLGFQICNKLRIKVGTSFLLNEKIPQGQERIPLLDMGKINGTIYGIEIQLRIK